jgi:fibronectin-binding autotransporter adhesin
MIAFETNPRSLSMYLKMSFFASYTTLTFRPFRHFLCLVPALALAGNAQAQLTWTGSVGASDFATAADWGGTTPATGDTMTFTSANASSTTTLTNDLSVTIDGLTFKAGAPAYTLTGITLDLSGGITDSSTATETINTGIDNISSHSWQVATGGNLVVGTSATTGVVTDGGGGQLKVNTTTFNAGTVTLGGLGDAFTQLIVANGTVVLDYGDLSTTAVQNNIYGNGTATLTLQGGTLQIEGNSTEADSQTFASLTLGGGTQGNVVISVAPVSGSVVQTLALGTGAITYNVGSSLDLIGPSTSTGVSSGTGQTGANGNGTTTGQTAATANITTATTNAVDGLLVSSSTQTSGAAAAYGTVGLYDFAGLSGTTIIGVSQETGTGDGGYNIASTSLATSKPNDIVASFTESTAGAYVAARFNVNSALTLTNGAASLDLGGILVTPNVGANNTTLASSSNSDLFEPGYVATSGSDASSMVIFQNDNSGILEITGAIGPGADASSTVVQAGTGTVNYGNNDGVTGMTGSYYLNGGVSEISADSGSWQGVYGCDRVHRWRRSRGNVNFLAGQWWWLKCPSGHCRSHWWRSWRADWRHAHGGWRD